MNRTGGVLAIASLVLAIACAKRADEAPSQTAASQAPERAAAPGAAPAPASPPPPPPPAEPPSSIGEGADIEVDQGLSASEPTTVAEAEAAFKTSSEDLEKLIGPLKADKTAGSTRAAPLSDGDTRCPKACKAFDSLRRAGDAICRLAGDADARCTRARDVVKQNATRVAVCGC